MLFVTNASLSALLLLSVPAWPDDRHTDEMTFFEIRPADCGVVLKLVSALRMEQGLWKCFQRSNWLHILEMFLLQIEPDVWSH